MPLKPAQYLWFPFRAASQELRRLQPTRQPRRQSPSEASFAPEFLWKGSDQAHCSRADFTPVTEGVPWGFPFSIFRCRISGIRAVKEGEQPSQELHSFSTTLSEVLVSTGNEAERKVHPIR